MKKIDLNSKLAILTLLKAIQIKSIKHFKSKDIGNLKTKKFLITKFTQGKRGKFSERFYRLERISCSERVHRFRKREIQ
jgi:hypothetical protein